MRRRWIVLLAGIAVLLAALTVGAALRYLIPQLTSASFRYDGTEDQFEIDQYWLWINSGWPFYSMVPWLATAALLAGVAALALGARRAQLASAVATASRESATS
jgi:hypothetical protein